METMVKLARIMEHAALPEVCMHLQVHKDGEFLLSGYDFGPPEPIYVSKHIPEEDVRTFCEAAGWRYGPCSEDW